MGTRGASVRILVYSEVAQSATLQPNVHFHVAHPAPGPEPGRE